MRHGFPQKGLIFLFLIMLSGCTSSDEEHVTLEAYYSFDNIEGAQVFNVNFNDLHGNIVGAQIVDGKDGQALGFSSSAPSYVDFGMLCSSYSYCPDFPRGELSIEAWVKFDALNPAETYFFFGNASLSGISRFAMDVDEGQFRFRLVPTLNGQVFTQPTLLSSNYPFTLDVWYHIAFTYDSQVARFYINGALNTERAELNTLFKYVNYMTLGGAEYVASFPGAIDEFRFSQKLRTAEEIEEYYNRTR